MGQSAKPTARPPVTPFRVEEDWTFLRDRSLRNSPVNALKFIPLGERVSLTLGGEFRHRYEYFQNDLWGAFPEDNDGYHLFRMMLFADLRIDGRWRFFGELKSGLVADKQSPVKPPDQDDFDLHQAFIEYQDFVADSDTRWLLRAGRQELNYGSSRILTFRDGPNVRQSFDAVLGRIWQTDWKIDAFYARPVETDPAIFDDQTQDDQLVYGVYGVAKVPGVSGANLDLYFLGYERDSARFSGLIADEKRYSVGARLWGRQGSWDYNFEGLWQWGDFGDSSIRAWTFASDFGRTFSSAPTQPRVSMRFDVSSGDDDRNDGELNTFNALYPRGSYFGDIALLGPSNLIDVHPAVSGKIGPHWQYNLDAIFFWRESTDDGVYNAGGALVRAAGESTADFIGTQAGITLTWSPNAYFSVEWGYAHFWAGDFLNETRPGEDVDYVSVLTRYRF